MSLSTDVSVRPAVGAFFMGVLMVIYCELVNIWVMGLSEDGKKVTYTAGRRSAKRFNSEREARSFLILLPPIWRGLCKVMPYAESTQLHDRYFAKQDRLYGIKRRI